VGKQIEKKEAYIRMTDRQGSSDFIMVPDFKKSLSDSVKISYPSLNKNREERVIIITPQ
jgi:hypothetical protein